MRGTDQAACYCIADGLRLQYTLVGERVEKNTVGAGTKFV